MYYRLAATAVLVTSFCILSYYFSYHQDDDIILGGGNNDGFPTEDVPGNYYKRLCPINITNHTYLDWVNNKDECSLNCNSRHSFQGHPGGSTSSLFFALPVIWTLGKTKHFIVDIILSVHFIGLMVSSLMFHATRILPWWRADVAFTILSSFALLCIEFCILPSLTLAKRFAICSLYLVVISVTAFVWNFDKTISDDDQGLFQLLVALIPFSGFLLLLSKRIRAKERKRDIILACTSVVLAIMGLLLLASNVEKENENKENWLYFCLTPFFSSLAVGHIVLSLSVLCIGITYTRNMDLQSKPVYIRNTLIF